MKKKIVHNILTFAVDIEKKIPKLLKWNNTAISDAFRQASPHYRKLSSCNCIKERRSMKANVWVTAPSQEVPLPLKKLHPDKEAAIKSVDIFNAVPNLWNNISWKKKTTRKCEKCEKLSGAIFEIIFWGKSLKEMLRMYWANFNKKSFIGTFFYEYKELRPITFREFCRDNFIYYARVIAANREESWRKAETGRHFSVKSYFEEAFGGLLVYLRRYHVNFTCSRPFIEVKQRRT